MSFSYGEMGGRGLGSYAAGLGELGTGFAGLRLRLRARPPATLHVLYRTELLYEEHLSREIALQLGAAFVPVVISYGRGASGGGELERTSNPDPNPDPYPCPHPPPYPYPHPYPYPYQARSS